MGASRLYPFVPPHTSASQDLATFLSPPGQVKCSLHPFLSIPFLHRFVYSPSRRKLFNRSPPSIRFDQDRLAPSLIQPSSMGSLPLVLRDLIPFPLSTRSTFSPFYKRELHMSPESGVIKTPLSWFYTYDATRFFSKSACLPIFSSRRTDFFYSRFLYIKIVSE